jgi:hypothetical protein
MAHGGSLTINPETGLLEAGFLMKILPIVAAGALTYFTAGAAAPLLEASLAGTAAAGMGGALAGAGAGALVGGTSAAIQGGDVGKAAVLGGLGGAISGGMGAYDSVYSGVNAGAQLPGAAVTPNGMPVPVDSGAGAGVSGYGEANALTNPASAPTASGAPAPSGAPGSPGAPGGPPTKEFNEMYRAGVPTPSTGDDKAKLEAAKSYYSTMSTPGKMFTQALPGIGAAMGEKPNTLPGLAPFKSSSTLSPDFEGYTPPQPEPHYQAQYTRYAADGGLMALAGGENPRKKKQRAALTADRTMAAMPADQAGLAMLNNARYGANMTGASPLQAGVTSLGDLPSPVGAAGGGLADLGGYSDGGRLLKGPGDGMSDNIPAQIGRKQPARLADGEFVVPADVVSHLGNGSTDAGARRLYAMMDRARQARTGKKKQAPAVNTQRMMPA